MNSAQDKYINLFYIPLDLNSKLSGYFVSIATSHTELHDSYIHVMVSTLYTWLRNTWSKAI